MLTKASSILMHVTYTGKPMSLANMDRDKHPVMIMHTMQYEYMPTTVALSAYPHHKVKSTHDHERAALLTMAVHHKKCMTTHKQPQTNKHIYTHTHTHTYIMHNASTQSKETNQTLPTFQGYAQQGMRNVNQKTPYLRNTAQARYKKDKSYMPTSKGYGQTRYWKDKIDFAIRQECDLSKIQRELPYPRYMVLKKKVEQGKR